MATNSESKTQGRAKRAYSFGQRQVDRVISPQQRQRSYDATAQFAQERPVLFAFLASQLFFSALPVGLFVSFCLSTVAFAIVSAIAFSFFWVGIAVLVLVPILFITISIAIFVWLWALVTFLVGRKVYRMLPVIVQKDRRDGLGIDHSGFKKETIEGKE